MNTKINYDTNNIHNITFMTKLWDYEKTPLIQSNGACYARILENVLEYLVKVYILQNQETIHLGIFCSEDVYISFHTWQIK